MLQLALSLKTGKMKLLEVPFPALLEGNVMVRNHYSVISAGTESRTVKDASLGYIGKAKARQKEVKQVIETIKTNGLLETYKIVMNKLEAPSSIGYSCAGEVIALGNEVNDLKVGDYVACGGQSAYHAEVVSVPRNLCVKVLEEVDLKHAAFTTIASISIQGIRQAQLALGESCVVIGLGLLGQLTIHVLNTAGIRSIGIDIDERKVKLANENGALLALNRNQANIEDIILGFTNGYGADAVIITAASSSTDPINLAGALCRKKGKVVLVGRVLTNFDRTNYYNKELDLRMSTSYGPGRYDKTYEEKGNDYPIGYVRWTENRNMQSFIDLLNQKKVKIDGLITHIFDIKKAPEAYQMILKKSEKFTGILIKYDIEKELKRKVILADLKYPCADANIGFIGAGSFSQNILLPRMAGLCNFVGVTTAKGRSARYVADKYKFSYCTDNVDDIINDDEINTLFITTPHYNHTEYAIRGLTEGKNVFVEKPLSINLKELEEIRKVYEGRTDSPRLMVGYNRRFSPHVQELKKRFLDIQPKAISYRINAGVLPADHWMHDPEIGGGRIISEVCHFIDLTMFITGSKISSIFAHALNEPANLFGTVTINLSFKNGSIATISYFSNGNKKIPKEYLEIFCDREVAIIDDFKKMKIFSNKISKYKLSRQDKGHKEEIKLFLNSIKKGLPSPIPFDEIYLSTYATLKVTESMKQNKVIKL